MGVVCQILFQKSKEDFFRAGEAVLGTLKYFIHKPTKLKNIYISFLGKGTCNWNNSKRSYINEEEYVKLFKNVFTASDDQNVLSGAFECPFEFLLPHGIPSSIKNSICTIEYKVIVTFTKDNYFRTKYEFDAKVPVSGYVSPCGQEPLIFGLQKSLVSLTSDKKIDIRAEIERTFLSPGENITLNLTIHNDTDVPITIKTELVKHFTYVSECKSTNTEIETLKTTTGYYPITKEKTLPKLTCIVPTLPSLYSIQNTKILIGEYKVRVTAELPFPHINAVAEVPVVIGERRDHLGVAVMGYANGGPSSSKMLEKYDIHTNEENFRDYFEKYDSVDNNNDKDTKKI